MYTVALAYAGTSNNYAIRKLLHVAVSDTSDDVRRAAVTSLAFVLFKYLAFGIWGLAASFGARGRVRF